MTLYRLPTVGKKGKVLEKMGRYNEALKI